MGRSGLKFITILLAAALGGTSLWATPLPTPGDRLVAAVDYVYDGDTFKAHAQGADESEQFWVRIYLINTAEIKRPRCDAEKSIGYDQRDYLRQIMPETVTLEVKAIDRYGRVVAVVYGTAGDDIGNRMMREAGAKNFFAPGGKEWCG